MLKNFLVFAGFLTSFLPSFGQNKDTTSVTLYNPTGAVQIYRLNQGSTFSYRGTGTYHNMTSWDSSPYLQGYLEGPGVSQTWEYKMNYRLLPPLGYDPDYSKGYPLIMMLHGAGERGNCWNNGGANCPSGGCYYSNWCWDPNNAPPGAVDNRLLNNDHNLVHGGLPHLTARNLAGTKKPDDPTLSPRAFPGFIFFPQNLNGWNGSGDVALAIRTLRLLLREYNIDEDRIYVHGLSNGGQGSYHALNLADWLFAAAAPMSAISSTGLLQMDSSVTVPLWIFQGEKDNSPTPSTTESLVRSFLKAGGSVRYTKYPNLGHGVWNSAYAEPEFFSWLLSKNKRQIHVYYDSPNICAPTGAGARLALAQGFQAYQWELDGQIISGATGDQHFATLPGVYRARFSRKKNPTESDWNLWSDPVIVSENNPAQATISQLGTTYLTPTPNMDGSSSISLKADGKFANYYWYKNGILFNTAQDQDTIQNITIGGACGGGACANNGIWTLQTAGFDNCLSPVSDPKYLYFLGQPAPNTLPVPSPASFQGKITSPTSVLMTWSDASNLERGYELWRKKTTEPNWKLAVITGEDVISYHDTGLDPNGTYWYKVRAISSTATSNYSPANDKSQAVNSRVITFSTEASPPSPPQNLTANLTQVNTITLSWDPSNDNSGIQQYVINYGSTSINTHSTNTTYTIPNLPINTKFYFTVKAVDKAGNFSPASNQAIATTYMTGLFYRHSNAAYLTSSGTPDIRLVPWPSGSNTPQNIKTNVTISGSGPTYSGTFLNAAGEYVMYGSVFFRNNGNNGPIFAHVDSNGNIIREIDGNVIGSCNLFAVPGTYSFTESGLSNPRLDYTWTFIPENNGTAPYFSTEYPPNGPLTQDDFFIIDYDGYLNINTAGNYRFQTISDDAIQLFIDNVSTYLLEDRTGQTTTTTNEAIRVSGNVYLASGPHRIIARFMEYSENHRLTVQYRGTTSGLDVGTTFVDIPPSALKSGNYTTPPPPAVPINLAASGESMTQNDLSWSGGALKVVVLGSSTAVGTGASAPIEANGWVGQFTNWLTTTVPGSTVTNLAVGGYSTNSILPGANPANNITAALALNPNLIIVNLPSNDVWAGLSNTQTINNYNTIKALADARGIPLYIATTQPRNGTTSQMTQLQDQAQAIRDNFGNRVIDIYDELAAANLMIEPIYDSGDGIHVNDAGHTYIFSTARDLLAPLIATLTNFEIHRATNLSGPFSLINNTSDYLFSDTGLTPGTTYYYKLKTVDINGTSGFSSVAVATTLTDSEPPSQPTGLAVTTATFANVSLLWNAAIDNVKVTGYEIYADGAKIGTSTIPGYLVKGLTPNTTYSFTVKAIDASNNLSLASSAVNATTGTPVIYYSKDVASGTLNSLSTWGTQPDGSGAAPSTFSANGQYYTISNRPVSSLGVPWAIEGSVSKVIVPDNVVFTNDNVLNATLQIQGTGKVVLQNNVVPKFSSLSPQSIVEYQAPIFIKKAKYGNLSLVGTGYKTFSSDSTWVAGDITATAGVAIRGAGGGNSTVILSGNLTLQGVPGYTPPDFGIDLVANKNGAQSITSGGNLSLHKITLSTASELTINSSGSPLTLSLGSLAGGGLSLAAGSTLKVNSNNLLLTKAAAINNGGETGRIAIVGGNIEFNSTAGEDSNLYFDPTLNSVNRFIHNLTGTGKTLVQEPVQITEALKMKNGEINAGGFVSLISNATKTANIEQIEGSGLISGNVNVQRYLAPKGKVYRYFSTPVAGVTVADWQASFPITGNFTGFTPGYSMNPSMFFYNEPAGGWLPYPPPGSNNAMPIEKGVGYSPFLRNGDTNITMQVAGNPFQGDVNYTISPDPSPASTDGYNLVGNPYASTISWGNNGWTKSGLSNTIAVKDNPSGNFLYYFYDPILESGFGDLTDGIIAAGQAFWVQAIDASPILTIKESAKETTQGTIYRQASSVLPHLKVSLIQGEQIDPTYILLTDQGTGNYDPGLDAPKRPNDKINFSSTSLDGISLAINNIGTTFCAQEITLNLVNTAPGEYAIRFEEFNSQNEIGSVFLTDLYTGSTINLHTETVYTFNITAEANTYGSNRFKITLSRPAITPVLFTAQELCNEDFVSVNVTSTQLGVQYQAYDGNDNALSSIAKSTSGELSLKIPKTNLTNGTNTIVVKSGYTGCQLLNATVPIEFNFAPNPTVTVTDTVSLCAGTTGLLSVNGTPPGGSYNWYNSNNELIDTNHGSEFETNTIKFLTQFSVAAVNGSGCEGEKRTITIIPEIVPTPELVVEGESIITTAVGSIQWYLNSIKIENETTSTITPTIAGQYTSTSTVGGCTNSSQPVNFVVSNISENNLSSQVRVYPNPTHSNNLNIRLESITGPIYIQIVDGLGKSFYKNFFDSTSSNNDIKIITKEELANGIYLLKISNRENIWVNKIVIAN